MAYRSGTYIAFDGLGQTQPTLSDFKYYSTIQAWTANKDIEFRFVNSHDKTYAVRDSSKRATLEARIRERLANSKNVLVILSDHTRKSGSMLSFEIEQAVDNYGLPLVCAYTNCDFVLDPAHNFYTKRWPTALALRINKRAAKAIHIPFKKDPLLEAINQFTVHNGKLNGSLVHYTGQAHKNWGLV